MKAFVWKQPFASAMFHGKVETRSYSTTVRGEVLICSALQPYPKYKWFNLAGDRQMYRLIETLREDRTQYLQGYALGVATLTTCWPMMAKDEDKTFVQYNPNLWCWIFENVRRIDPFPWKWGKQGWLTVPDSELTKIIYLP